MVCSILSTDNTTIATTCMCANFFFFFMGFLRTVDAWVYHAMELNLHLLQNIKTCAMILVQSVSSNQLLPVPFEVHAYRSEVVTS